MRSCPCPLPHRQPFVVFPEQIQGSRDVLLTPDAVADPPGLRQHVMNLRLARLDQLLPYPHRKGKVSQPVAVQVPDLMPVHPKLDPAEPVCPRLDPWPSRYLTLDSIPDARHAFSCLANIT